MPEAVIFVVLAPPDIVNSPLVMVEDALERKPPLKSEAVAEDVATKYEASRYDVRCPAPVTSSLYVGDVFPIPTFPDESTNKISPSDEFVRPKYPLPEDPTTSSLKSGERSPNPTLPAPLIVIFSVLVAAPVESVVKNES